MFIPDMPNVPPQDVPVMIAQANQVQSGDLTTTRTIGVCFPAPNDNYSGENGLSPINSAAFYLRRYEHQKVADTDPATITILQQPSHGTLRLVTEADGNRFGEGRFVAADQRYVYLPEKGYLGKDSATVLVEIGGVKVKVVFFFQAISGGLGSYGIQEYCGKTGYRWKISSTIDVNGTSTLSSVEYQSTTIDVGTTTTDPATLASTLGTSILSSLSVEPSAVTFNLADLPNGAVGQTNGTSITLDTNAAGHNWFIDTTPWDNSEYLPTSNPYEWVAKAGSAAEGKMDMLSVLLHEYGHALGIEHSADGHDYMATTLTPGVRRMPNAEELALMQDLVAQIKGIGAAKDGSAGNNSQDNAPTPFPTLPLGGGIGLAFLGRLRNSRFGGTSIDVVGAPTITQYAVAANATFANLNTAAGWNTQGSVGITSGTATLNEVSTSQTRLSQVFMLNDQDRYLSFTLSGTALDDLNGAPDDAFEVALLDANTGASLLGGTGLTRSDAFLNLQSDGTQNAASCVTCINNADGSRTYRVDLTGIAAGTVANLSFDLLGFGASNSRLTLSDIRVSGLPQLHDDVATLAEDNLLSFDPFAQADSQLKPLLASHIVTGPTHGALAVNVDGTFSYTPALNYFGIDSFSYRLSDGPLDSNLATVNLTVTPVNDAPVAADVQAATAEDTALVIALGTYASDVDSTTLTTQIVTGPTHGVLTQNADGSYSYTPYANYNGADSFTYRINDGALDSNIATVTLAITSVNDAPQGLGANVTTLEDTDYVFQLADFGFSDALDAGSNAGANNFSAVTISSLPLAGTLTNNGIVVVAGQSISVADIVLGLLKFAPAYNANGAGYASFTFQVQDDGGVLNGGVDIDQTARTMTIAVTAVNDAPVAMDAQATTNEDTPLNLNLLATASDVDGDVLTPVIIAGPQHGQLVSNPDGKDAFQRALDTQTLSPQLRAFVQMKIKEL
ncbi:MAG: hypothetical protein A2V79_06080 [Betaproteobacteria bacterium RBG_16_56_24]|nr:MAG: hypothetical protein A2V79_06080 [Betaproteobacteria bacterium RBG_16_56_24]